MAQTPHPQPQPKPPTTPPKPPDPPKPAANAPPLPIGAKPLDPKDPQAIKFEPPLPAPPEWQDPNAAKPEPHEQWVPEPALDPHAEKPPKTAYADGMDIATEQRARAAWVEAHGIEKYDEAVDQRKDDEKPKFDKNALSGGGAFVSAGKQSQVQGVAPPTKRPEVDQAKR